MFKLIAILVLLVSGCATSTIPNAFVPEGFSVAEVEILQRSAQRWVDASNGDLQVIILDIGTNCPECSRIKLVDNVEDTMTIGGLQISSEDKSETSGGSCESAKYVMGIRVFGNLDFDNDNDSYFIQIKNFRGYENDDYCKQIAYPDHPEESCWFALLNRAATHEIGHCPFGKSHIGIGNVMAPDAINQPTDGIPTQADLAE